MRGGALALGLLASSLATPFACGDLGEPAFVGSEGGVAETPPPPASDAEVGAGEASEALKVSLEGTVLNPAGAPIVGLVAVEVGGLDQENPGAVGPDGSEDPTSRINPYYRYGTTTNGAGEFSLDVPLQKLGVHVYANGFYCGVPSAGAIDPSSDTTRVTTTVRPLPVEETEGGTVPAKPTVTGFTLSAEVIAPGETLTLAARVDAIDPENDPLSEQVLAIEPRSTWAGILAPPIPGSAVEGYPNGVYSRLASAPTEPGEYVYYLVAATRACVVSDVATARVRVTLTGEGGLEDGGVEEGNAD
jgi:hypothetical protein